ncbi:MAG: Bacterial Ig-like domain [Capsulimonas sp.]|nr:Bacterial Ig-like domain [Capsulimonas sp.]
MMMDENGFPGSVPGLDRAAITVSSPTPGQVFSPGDKVTVVLIPINGAVIQWAQMVTSLRPAHGEMTAMPPFSMTFTIPETTLGNVRIVVTAGDPIGNRLYSEVNITVAANAVINAIVLTPRIDGKRLVTLTGLGETQAFLVNCLYSDGVTRDVTQYQTQYSSSDPSVATVSDAGVVTAVGIGCTYITAAFGGKVDRVPVVVALEPPCLIRMSPIIGARPGQTVILQIEGKNFGGLTKVELLSRSGQPEPRIVVSDLRIEGVNVVTINVAIAEDCPPDQYAVVVTSTGGTSEPHYKYFGSTFTVTPPANTVVVRSIGHSDNEIVEVMIVLSDPSPDGGLTVMLSSNNPAAQVPVSIFMNHGLIFQTFQIWPAPALDDIEITITETVGGRVETHL